MIIHKKELGDDWPFTVDEVEIRYELLHNGFMLKYGHPIYALDGFLECHGCLPLEQSGIWADDPEIPGAKKSITPLMEFLRERAG